MDTVHDLGGRQGFGSIKHTDEDDAVPFKADWEARSYAICMLLFSKWRNMDDAPNMDWFRHVRERIDPVDYLTRPYFDQWAQSVSAMLVEQGIVDLKDLTGTAASDLGARPNANSVTPSEPLSPSYPTYEIGQWVVAKRTTAHPYTRLPGYIRGRKGKITLRHGPQLLADVLALGLKQEEQMYTVAFDANELWPDEKRTRDRVCIDLWESHLEPAP